MKQVGYVSKIDSLGRIVIPKPVRKMYEMEKEDAVEILAKDNGLLIRKYKPSCVFCGETENIIVHEGHNVCEACIKKLMTKAGL